MEVTQYLRQLTQRGEMYKYLNRYIIGFEDKYYAAYSGISDINEAMRIADGGRLTKTEEEKAEEIPWREDEGINFRGGKHLAGLLYETMIYGKEQYDRRRAYEKE